MSKKVLVIGAGPAGLTAAYELLSKAGSSFDVTVIEESDAVGGISRTVNWHGNRMDMGGHRFFSKSSEVNEWWDKMLPRQGAPAYDYKILGRESALLPDGPDPEKSDRVMLRRHRVSRILFNGNFFDYPITLKPATLKSMGLCDTILSGFSYLNACMFPKEEKSLEDFYINRFGRKLYRMFFERYTENLWGRHPSAIDPSWGAQRVKGVSIKAVLANAIGKIISSGDRKVETSLIEEFGYPKLGPGELWEITADEIQKLGGRIIKNAKAVKFCFSDGQKISSAICRVDGKDVTFDCDIVISSMPLKDLVAGFDDAPSRQREIAAGLPYRDFMTVGVLVRRLLLKNETNIKTLGNIVPDNWIYVHDKSVQMGRLQIFNNWSPYMVSDPEHTVWVGLEYFCNEGDEMWSSDESAFARKAINEMITLGMIAGPDDVLDSHVERVKKAYPAYFDTYSDIDELRDYLDTIENLYCVGRNGQHRYNNIDHSMCTAFESVKNILGGIRGKENIWSVNTEESYHEEK